MPAEFLDIAMTPDVMDVQHEMGSDELWQSPHRQRRGERFGASEEAMIATRDSFYLYHPFANRLALYSASRRPGGLSASAG